jgi:TetR/AcrR family transcriptional repressor of nem operon
MGRATQSQARKNRDDVVRAASQLFRERGVSDVSVADVMANVGLTPGGFYKQFASKEHLLGEATDYAFDEMRQLLSEFDAADAGDHRSARQAFIEFYLSEANRDDVSDGCPAAGLAVDIARRTDSPARAPYAGGVESFATWLSENGNDLDVATLSTMVGALILSRATAGTDISARILAGAKASISDPEAIVTG